MLTSHPRLQAMFEKQPDLKHALSDPKALEELVSMSVDRQRYQEVMRGHDRALSNLANQPRGFQYLVEMQKKMAEMEALGMGEDEGGRKGRKHVASASGRVQRAPLPNPWAQRSVARSVFGTFSYGYIILILSFV